MQRDSLMTLLRQCVRCNKKLRICEIFTISWEFLLIYLLFYSIKFYFWAIIDFFCCYFEFMFVHRTILSHDTFSNGMIQFLVRIILRATNGG